MMQIEVSPKIWTKKIFSFIFTAMMLAMCPAAAQNLKFDIVKFELNQLDGTASNKNYEKIDGSGNKYAIIKVRSTDGDEGLSEFMFNFNSLKSIVEDKGDELWVYVQKNAKMVTISREGYTPLRNFDLKTTLQAGKTYNMEITYDRVEKVVKKELRMQMLSFKLTPAVEGAMVMYKEQGTDNDELFGQTNKQGMVSKNLKFGTYEYKVLASNYFATEGIVKLNNSDEVYTENITLKPNFSNITLITNEGADIYVNNELKGRSKWTGALKAGEYVVECKQEGHRPTNQGITVEVNADKSIELQRPIPITGYVSVISDPAGATVLIDGKESGKTPCNIKEVLVGNRRVTLTLTGYAQATKEVVVKEGEVADVSLTLKNTATSTFTTTTQKPVDPELEKIFQKGYTAYNNKNYAEAVKWYRKAAEQGHATAQNNLGVCYDRGQGVEKNYTEAAKWYRKAAERGNASAQFHLGQCYEFSGEVGIYYVEAAKWYTKAAKQGNENAQKALKRPNIANNTRSYTTTRQFSNAEPEAIYREGLEAYYKERYAQAVIYFRKAAEQGHADAQSHLGLCYDIGYGVARNEIEAVKWYKKAAEQRESFAQFKLAEMYEKGEGVDKDIAEAVKWYNEAIKNKLFAKEAKNALKRLRKEKLIDKKGVPIK